MWMLYKENFYSSIYIKILILILCSVIFYYSWIVILIADADILNEINFVCSSILWLQVTLKHLQ